MQKDTKTEAKRNAPALRSPPAPALRSPSAPAFGQETTRLMKGKTPEDDGKKTEKDTKRTSKSDDTSDDTSDCDSDNAVFGFNGIATAFSVNRGVIQASWLPATLAAIDPSEENFSFDSCPEIMYTVFVAEAPFEFGNATLVELLDDIDLLKFETEGTSISIDGGSGIQTGVEYSLLVVAQVGDDVEFSSPSRLGSNVLVSHADPVLRNDIQRLVDATSEGIRIVRIDDAAVTFSASSDILSSIMVNDTITGIDVNGEPLMGDLVSLIDMTNNTSATWRFRDRSLVEIFQRLSLGYSMDVDTALEALGDLTDEGGDRRIREQQGGRRLGVFDIDVSASNQKRFPLDFVATAELGLAKLTYKLEMTQKVSFSLNLEADILGVDRLDIEVRVEREFKNTIDLQVAKGVDENRDRVLRPLWRSPPIRAVIVVLGVPVHLLITPAVLYTYDFKLELALALTLKGECTSRSTSVTSFTLATGWTETNPPSPPTYGGDVSLRGKATLASEFGLRFQLGVLIYGAAFVAPYFQGTLFSDFEATTYPNRLLTTSPFFSFTKLDFGLKAALGISAEFVVDIPFVDEDTFKLDLSVETPPFFLLSLPTVDFKTNRFDRCVGDNAIELVASVEPKPSDRLLQNDVEEPYDWIPIVEAGFLFEDDAWQIDEQDLTVTLRLPRSVIESREFYETPTGTLYFRSHATFLPDIFALLFDQDIRALPSVNVFENFDCCEDSDCLLKFGDEGDEDRTCDNFKCSDSPSASPTPPPTREEEDPDRAGSFGDPHLFSFDSLSYSCQATGDYILTRSLDSGMQVQARFEALNLRATFTTGIVATPTDSSPVVELRISEGTGRPTILRVDGVLQNSTDYEDGEVQVTQRGKQFFIDFFNDGLRLNIRRLLPRFPHFFVETQLSPSIFRTQRIVGLLGSPNDNPLDDWTDQEGNVLPFDGSGVAGFNYCQENWCIRNETDSLFTYTPPNDFNFYATGCSAPYGGDIDLSAATPELRALCGLNTQCLIDGIELGPEGGQNALEAQTILVGASSASRFRFDPSSIRVGFPVNVNVQINLLSNSSGFNDTDIPADLDRFNLYRADSSGAIIGTAIAVLRDDGMGNDETAGDFVFTNVLAVESVTAGEAFNFRAIPVVAGSEDLLSPFGAVRLNAVVSFSEESGLGESFNFTIAEEITVEFSDDLMIAIQYSWPIDQPDLDSGTFFLGQSVGFSCGSSSQYLIFTGDDTNFGGSETATVLLGKAVVDEVLIAGNFTTKVNMFAQWFLGVPRGPASVTIFAERLDPATGQLVRVDTAISFAYSPPSGDGCAAFPVGQIDLNAEGTSVTITVSNRQS